MVKNKFNLVLTTTVAASLSACGPSNHSDWDDGYTQYADRDTAVCVDQKTKQRVPDSECRRGGSRGGWYYLGRNSAIPYYGEPVRGGSYRPVSGSNYYYAPKSSSVTRNTAISRGGFGSSSHGSVSSGS